MKYLGFFRLHLDQIRYGIDEIIVPYFDSGDYKHKPIESIQGRDKSKWQTRRVGRAKELSKDWGASTLNKSYRVLRQIFQYAKKDQLIDVIPDIQDVPENNREARHVAAVWDHVDDWWNNPDVRAVLEKFKNRYCQTDALLDRVEFTLDDVVAGTN